MLPVELRGCGLKPCVVLISEISSDYTKSFLLFKSLRQVQEAELCMKTSLGLTFKMKNTTQTKNFTCICKTMQTKEHKSGIVNVCP